MVCWLVHDDQIRLLCYSRSQENLPHLPRARFATLHEPIRIRSDTADHGHHLTEFLPGKTAQLQQDLLGRLQIDLLWYISQTIWWNVKSADNMTQKSTLTGAVGSGKCNVVVRKHGQVWKAESPLASELNRIQLHVKQGVASRRHTANPDTNFTVLFNIDLVLSFTRLL